MPRDKRKPHADPLRWGRDEKLRLLAHIEAEEAAEKSRELEAKGWRHWYSTMFDEGPSAEFPEGRPFVARLAPHHEEAIQWHWLSLMLKRAGQDIEKYAYLAIWPRGHMKSTIARYIAICDAALSNEGYCLYVSGTKGKVRSHAISIESLLASPKLLEYYPKLGVVKKGATGQSKGWTQHFIYTEASYVFHFVSLDEGVAGANVDNIRPTLIIPDDVDDRNASALVSENRMRVLTRAVLPTRQHNTLVFWAQNLINRHSVLYHVYTGKQRVLTARVNTKPIIAFDNFATEQRVIDGIIHDVIIRGDPTWPWYDIKRAQEEIDTIGLPAFMAEIQQDVEADKSEQIIPEFDEVVHLITWEEFNAVYNLPSENRDVPRHWRRYVGHDWGSTGSEAGHACVVGYVSVAAQNGPLPSTAFFYHLASFERSVLAGQVARSVLNFVLWDIQSDPRTYIELGLLDRGVNDPGDLLAVRARDQVISALSQREQWTMFHMSHEAKAVRDIYRIVYGLGFQPCNPRRDGGVAQLRHYLRTDYSQPHPFRPNHPGLSRMYFIVENESERLRPTGDSGLKLAREQLPEWRWRPDTLTAKGFVDERPLKINDDVGNMLQMIFTHFRLSATPLTESESFESRIPIESRYSTLLANSPFENGLLPEQELQLIIARAHARKTSTSQIDRFDEMGEKIR